MEHDGKPARAQPPEQWLAAVEASFAAVEARLAAGIAQHRQGEAKLRLMDSHGRPLAGVEVELRQVSSPFLFGASAGGLGASADPDANARWEQVFLRLFGLAVAAGPAPELSLAWCRTQRLAAKLRARLAAAADAETVAAWCTRLARRPGERSLWVELASGSPLPPPESWRRAQAILADAPLLAGLGEQEPDEAAAAGFAQALRKLLRARAPVQALSLPAQVGAAGAVPPPDPARLLATLDGWAALGLPLHLDPVAVSGRGPWPEAVAEELQARLLRPFYRLWFSHPAVAAIAWGELTEDGSGNGLLRADLSPKPASAVLERLLHQEWRSCLTVRTDATGRLLFRGFHGQYELRVAGRRRGLYQLLPEAPADVNLDTAAE